MPLKKVKEYFYPYELKKLFFDGFSGIFLSFDTKIVKSELQVRNLRIPNDPKYHFSPSEKWIAIFR